tara:strand:- start:462 stop:746 length:285 start_codon:yes stop_codon:yes gene_type:complete
MNKGRVIGLLKEQGDGILTYKDPKTRVITDHLCTLDFKNKYIKTRTKGKKPWPKNKTDIVVFNWTENRYWILCPEHVLKVHPLAHILRNPKVEL